MGDDLFGTGEVLGIIEIGEHIKIKVEDDSHPDPDVHVTAYFDGKTVNIERAFGECRYNHGDEAVVDALDALADASSSTNEEYNDIHTSPFVCNDCHRTWPSKYLPDSGEELCPDCRGA